MLKTYHRFFRTLFQVSDAAIVLASWFLAFYVRFEIQPKWLPAVEQSISFEKYSTMAFGLVMVWFLSLQLMGAYKSWRLKNIGAELAVVAQASGLAFLFSASLQLFFARTEFSRATFGLFFGFSVLGLVLSRLILRSWLSKLRRSGVNLRHALVIGNGELIETFHQKLKLRPELGMDIKGVVLTSGQSTFSNLGSLSDLEALLTQNPPDLLVVALKNSEMSLLQEILGVASLTNVHVQIIPDILNFAVVGFDLEEFDGLPVISLNQSPLVGWNSVLKRVSDIVYVTIALVVFAIPMLIIATLIKLTSRGPVLYSQTRMGIDGKVFRMYKFRSMRTDAEAKTGAVWAKKNDPRVTWIGRIIRKTSLDELPQLINVLLGDMSCVGPRPERPELVEQFKKEIPGYMLRHKVKAGMTGWAQISGFRGNTSLEGRIQYDLYYISNWSLWFDLKIMFLTVFKGFISPHAY